MVFQLRESRPSLTKYITFNSFKFQDIYSLKNQRIELKYIDKTYEDNTIEKVQKHKIKTESRRKKELSNL